MNSAEMINSKPIGNPNISLPGLPTTKLAEKD
jgi:hypothetical protein